MTDVHRDIKSPDGFRSNQVALFVSQLDDQNRRLVEDTRDMAAPQLEWQSGPGMNTIGMLLAHIAIVEVFWTKIGLVQGGFVEQSRVRDEITQILGIGMDGDGMPLKKDGLPPKSLAGCNREFFEQLLSKARAFTYQHTKGLDDADLDRSSSIARSDGSKGTYTVRWVLYHLLEHEAAHYGQLSLIRHQYRDAQKQVA